MLWMLTWNNSSTWHVNIKYYLVASIFTTILTIFLMLHIYNMHTYSNHAFISNLIHYLDRLNLIISLHLFSCNFGHSMRLFLHVCLSLHVMILKVELIPTLVWYIKKLQLTCLYLTLALLLLLSFSLIYFPFRNACSSITYMNSREGEKFIPILNSKSLLNSFF